MTAPIALTVHPGDGIPPTWRREMIADWLTANGINPNQVAVNHPITILTVPYRPDADPEGPWLIQVIVLTEYYVGPEGTRELNYLTREPVTCQRTIPLRTPFPTGSPDDEGISNGHADRQAAQEAPEEVLRDAREAGLSNPRQGTRKSGPVPGEAARNEGAAEAGPRRGHEAVPEPEEDRRRPEEEGVTG